MIVKKDKFLSISRHNLLIKIVANIKKLITNLRLNKK